MAWGLIFGLMLSPAPAFAAEADAPARTLWDLARKFYFYLVDEYRRLEARPMDGAGWEQEQASGRFKDGTELEVDLTLGQLILVEPLIIEKQGDGFMVRLSHFIEVLEFPIEIDEAGGIAKGWFIREDKPFSMNLEIGTLVTGTRRMLIDARDVDRRGDELWISDSIVSDWFGIDFDIDYQQLRIALKPAEPLPAQRRLARRSQRPAHRSRQAGPPRHPPHVGADRPITVPSIDTQLVGRVGKTQATDLSGGLDYAVRLRNGLFSGSLDGYVAGDTQKAFEVARLSLEFEEPSGVFGVEPITQVLIGDVRGVRTPLLGNGSLARGVYLSNLPLGRQLNTDTTVIEGTSFPGYDVQLFRNDVLIAFQEIGEDGRYEFRDVLLFAGDNEFRLRFFGPQGQVDEEVRSLTLDPTGLGNNGLSVEASFTEQGVNLFDEFLGVPDGGGSLRAAVRALYPLSRSMALEGSIESLELEGERQTVGFAGLSWAGSGWRLRGGIAANRDGDLGGEGVFQARIGTMGLRLEHREEGAFAGSGSGAVTRLSRAGLTGLVNTSRGYGLPPVNYNLSAKQQTTGADVTVREIGLGLGTQVAGVSVSNTITHESTVSEDSASRVRGGGQVLSARGPVRMRAGASYTVAPETTLDGWEAELGYQHSPAVTSEVEVRSDLTSDLVTYGASLNYDAGFARISPRVSYDNRKRLAGLVTMRMAAAQDPASGDWQLRSRNHGDTGRLSVRVFFDADEDGRFSNGDTVLPGVKIDMAQQRTGGITGSDGIAFVAGLRPFETTDVEIAADTLPEGWMQPRDPGWSYMPRPGLGHALDMPVVRVWTISGQAMDVSGGARRPMDGVTVVLRNRETGEVDMRVTSAGDGRYEMTGIRRGAYRIELDGQALAAAGRQQAVPRYVTTSTRTARYTDIDIVTAGIGEPVRYPSLAGEAQGQLVPLGAMAEAATGGAGHHAILVGHSRTRLGVSLQALRLKRRAGGLLHGLTPLVGPSEARNIATNPQAEFPVRLGHLATRDRAEYLCDILRANGEVCSVVLDWTPVETADSQSRLEPKT